LAYSLWGLFPIYFKLLAAARPLEILGHRVTWSAVFLAAVIGAGRGWGWLSQAVRRRSIWLTHAASAALLAANWYVYIWAVDRGRVVDASLGYFITPLVSVLIGVRLMGEALRVAQWLAVGTAAAGVAWLTWQLGEPPWIGLILAASFGSYGALRKTSPLGALEGLMLETLLLLPLSGIYVGLLAASGASDFVTKGSELRVLLVLSGPLTSVPLLLFAAGVRLIPLSLIGILQYVSPTVQLLLGVLLWREPFGPDKVLGYALIWLALAIYTSEGIRRARTRVAA
jgi:chloramphenicol-sensitive protein RarD